MPAVFFEKKDEEKIMIPERLAALREKMRAYGVDAYLVPTADYHESEYVGTYFKARTYITGFTGSAGTAVITQDEACLWTDGRYFVQAAKELAGTGVTLMKMGQEGVPTVEEYLQANTKEGMTIGFDGRVVNEMLGETLEKTLPERFLSYRSDLIGEIWSDRPALSAEPVWILDSKYTGESAADRLAKVREKMKENGAEVHILTALDDIAWMLNIRGNDIPCNPVVLSYLILTETEGHLFIQEATLNDEVKQYLAGLGISIHPYDAVYDFAASITGKTILLEKAKVNYTICQSVMGENTIVNVMNPASFLKAVKTPVEMENIRKAHIKDGVAVTRFVYWLKKNIGKIPMDEVSVAEKLESFRKEQEGYIEPSFGTISAYGPNAAMCHYQATKEDFSVLQPKGMYLVDSGGQYYEGTTDITRTIVVGPLTEEEKDEVRSQIGEFRKYAPLIQNGRYYRLTDPFKSEVCAWEIVGNSQEEVLLNVVMEEIHGNMTVNYVQLRGLDESALYKEQTTGRIYSGAALMHGGMPLPAEFGEYRAYQYHFVRE